MAARSTVSAASAAPPRFWLRPELCWCCILVLAGVLFYPRVQALLTPVPTVQIQMESSVLPDTAPNCAANPRVAAVLHAAMRGQTDAAVYDCDAGTLEACMAELLDDPELWVRSYRYTVHGGLNAHITVTFDWVYPDDGPARREELARTADGLLAAAPAEDYPARAVSLRLAAGARALRPGARRMTRRPTPPSARGRPSAAVSPMPTSTCSSAAASRRASSRVRPCPPSGTADSHAWVAAELDGAVYYFDPTWDLQDDESEAALPDYLSHTWFALTAERMAVRHTAEDPTLWPDSRANADNYYVRNGYTAVEASVAAAAAAVRSQWDDGRAVLEFRCETPEVYAGMRSLLFDRDRLWDVYRALGSYVPSSGYQCADDQQIIRLIPTR